MSLTELYGDRVKSLIEKIVSTQQEKIREGGKILADAIANDKIVFVFGTGGHSYIGAEESYYRAGGLVPVYAILDQGISIAHGSPRSSNIERTPGYAQAVLNAHPIEKGDVMVIVNAYGINSCTIDTALWCKEQGVIAIGITSPGFSKAVPSNHPARHPSKKNLYELADLYIDNHMPEKDAIIKIEGVSPLVSPVSTILNVFVINALVAEIVSILNKRGIEAPVFTSANIEGGKEANQRWLKKYSSRINLKGI